MTILIIYAFHQQREFNEAEFFTVNKNCNLATCWHQEEKGAEAGPDLQRQGLSQSNQGKYCTHHKLLRYKSRSKHVSKKENLSLFFTSPVQKNSRARSKSRDRTSGGGGLGGGYDGGGGGGGRRRAGDVSPNRKRDE